MASRASLLVYGLTTHRGSSWSQEQFDNDYQTNHMPRALTIPSMTTGLRYKNMNRDAAFTNLALYKATDISQSGHPTGAALSKEHADVGVSSDVVIYEELQRFEGQVPKTGNQGKILISVKMTPAEGADAEFDEWYRKQHLDMLSMVSGYRRTTRWKLRPKQPGKKDDTPTYLALHEYDAIPPPEQMKLVVGTVWSKKIIGESKAFVRDVWELVDVQGEQQKL